MNMFLLRDGLPADGADLTITGPHSEHIRTVLRASAGDTLKIGIAGGKTGHAVIRSVSREGTVIGDYVLDSEPPEPLPVSLAVALPRPQSLKKVLHFAASAGIPRLILFQSARVEKSYWNSSLLRPEALQAELEEGMEQGCTTRAPELLFFRSFREFMNAVPDLAPEGTLKVIAHPAKELFTPVPKSAKYLLAIGPEGGFLPTEVAAFENNGFLRAAFGRHILRVEFACSFITGCLMQMEK